jgi:hypothetical protein
MNSPIRANRYDYLTSNRFTDALSAAADNRSLPPPPVRLLAFRVPWDPPRVADPATRLDNAAGIATPEETLSSALPLPAAVPLNVNLAVVPESVSQGLAIKIFVHDSAEGRVERSEYRFWGINE